MTLYKILVSKKKKKRLPRKLATYWLKWLCCVRLLFVSIVNTSISSPEKEEKYHLNTIFFLNYRKKTSVIVVILYFTVTIFDARNPIIY